MGWNMITKNSVFLVLLIGLTMVLAKEINIYDTSTIDDLAENLMKSLKYDMPEEYDVDTLAEGDDVVINAPSFDETAQIMGKEMTSFDNRTIYAFRGIKFGLMPTETTRFKPPTPAEKYWTEETLDATKFGDSCPQPGARLLKSSEDCLVLNVYTPYLPDSETKKLPVMFFIHGGAFVLGDSTTYQPYGLLDFDVVLVTIQYRLGAFGFFMLNNLNAPGNAALYDMVEALHWTQDHIGDFGGDPEKVTIFGESAGSVSVSYMTIVEPAIGLFRAAISESGSILDPWAIDIDPTYAANFLAKEVGCDLGDPVAIYECMAVAKVQDLVQAEHRLISSDRRSGLMGFRGAAPSIQTFEPTDDFQLMVTKHPREYLPEGTFSNVPLMTGSNKQEGSLVLSITIGAYLVPNRLANNDTYMEEQMIQDIIGSIGIMDDSQSLSNALQEVYCYDVDMTKLKEVSPCMIDMLGAMYLKSGSWELSRLHSIYVDQPVYYYAFEYVTGEMGPFGVQPGVSHGAELAYIFPGKNLQEERIPTMRRMTRMWTNFAIHLNPTPEDDKTLIDLGVPIWTPYDHLEPHFLIIDDTLSIGDVYSDRWTITMDEIRSGNASTTTTTSPEDPSLITADCDYECTKKKLEQRDAFLAVMITFIVISVILAALAGFLFYKTRQ